MKTLHTIGYGNDSPGEFLLRLKDSGVNLLIDIRRADIKSWCHKYEPATMRRWLELTDWDGVYLHHHALGNYYGTLAEYSSWLSTEDGYVALLGVVDDITELSRCYDVPCLLCAEKRADNCHRQFVAARLAAMMGDEWEVVHL